MPGIGHFFDELKRQRVFQAAAVCVGNIRAATEIITFLIGAFRPDVNAGVAEGYVAAVFVAGFPVAIYLA